MPPIGSDRLEAGPYTMRPWAPADVSWVYDACQDASIRRWTRVPSPYRPSDAVDLIAASSSERASGRGAPMAIELTETGELLGSVALVRVDWNGRRAEVGYWLHGDARGRGVIKHVLPVLAAWVFSVLDLDVVEARVDHGNRASERALEDAGFLRIGDTHCRSADGAPDASLWELRRSRGADPKRRARDGAR